MASLRQKIHEDVKQTSKAHRFIRTLRDSRKLVRCYTQNIDGLETREGLCADLDRGKGNRSRFTKKAMSLPKAPGNFLPGGILDGGCEVVQLHGDLNLLRCNICRQSTKWDEYGSNTLLLRGNAPVCESCKIQDQDRRNRGKRGTRVGSLRPNIVLYGEEHPSMDAIGSISTHDLALGPDVLLILGTSLHVHGLKVLIKEFAKSVHARTGSKGNVIFVNLTQPSESVWNVVIDYWVSMDCDKWIDAMRRHRPDMWQIQENLEIQVKKPLSNPVKKIGGSRKVFGNIKVGNVIKKSLTCSKSKLGRSTAVPTSRRPLHTIINGCSKSLTFSENNSSTKFSPSLKQKGECDQLQTPPPSGHRCRLQEISRKRPLDDLDVPTTPSKRSKNTLSVWQDNEVDSLKR